MFVLFVLGFMMAETRSVLRQVLCCPVERWAGGVRDLIVLEKDLARSAVGLISRRHRAVRRRYMPR